MCAPRAGRSVLTNLDATVSVLISKTSYSYHRTIFQFVCSTNEIIPAAEKLVGSRGPWEHIPLDPKKGPIEYEMPATKPLLLSTVHVSILSGAIQPVAPVNLSGIDGTTTAGGRAAQGQVANCSGQQTRTHLLYQKCVRHMQLEKFDDANAPLALAESSVAASSTAAAASTRMTLCVRPQLEDNLLKPDKSI